MVGLTSDDGSYFFEEDRYKSDSFESFRDSSINLFKVIRRFGWCYLIKLSKHLQEAVVFQYAPWPDINKKETLRQGLIDLVTDFSFAAPAHAVLELHTKVAPGYLFVFSHRSKLNPLPSWKGAAHKDDTPYEFGFPFLNFTVLQQYDDYDRNVSEIMISLFTNFARTGNPTPQPVGGCTWRQFNETNAVYMNITAKPKMQLNFHIRNIAFWNKYYPQVLNFTSCKNSEVLESTSGNNGNYKLDFHQLLTIVMTLVFVRVYHS
jgi:carboxylesterase type B